MVDICSPSVLQCAMADWGPAVAEELRTDVRFALPFKVGKNRRPLTDTERDMVADAYQAVQLEGRTRAGAPMTSRREEPPIFAFLERRMESEQGSGLQNDRELGVSAW